MQKNLYEIPMGLSPTGGQMQVWWAKITFIDRYRSLRFRRLTADRKFVSIRPGSPLPRRCVGGGLRCVINNVGSSRSWLITVTVLLTWTKLVVWKFVDDMHG